MDNIGSYNVDHIIGDDGGQMSQSDDELDLPDVTNFPDPKQKQGKPT